jgi:hypothetical protein
MALLVHFMICWLRVSHRCALRAVIQQQLISVYAKAYQVMNGILAVSLRIF